MITKELKGTKAITLIAMVISILVLLILAGVSIGLIVGETGITQRAVIAKKTYDIAGAKEQVELLVEGYIGDYYGKKYTSGESVSQDIGTYVAAQLSNDTTVGDYTLETSEANVTLKKGEETVAKGKINASGGLEWSNSLVATWEQDGTSVTNGDVILEVGSAITGYSVTVDGTEYGDGNWYVLGAEDGNLLITTNTNVESVEALGKDCFATNGEPLDTAARKYTNTDLADTFARSIKIDDLNRVTGFSPSTYQSGVGGYDEYKKDIIYSMEDGSLYYQIDGVSSSKNVAAWQDFKYWNGRIWTTLEEGENIAIPNNAYSYNPLTVVDNAIEENSLAYLLLFADTGVSQPWGAIEPEEKIYALASSYSQNDAGGECIFGLFSVGNGCVRWLDLAISNYTGYDSTLTLWLRPVVSLKSDLKISQRGEISK